MSPPVANCHGTECSNGRTVVNAESSDNDSDIEPDITVPIVADFEMPDFISENEDLYLYFEYEEEVVNPVFVQKSCVFQKS